MKKKHLIILLIIVPITIYAGSKVIIYQKVKSLFTYSWNSLDNLEIIPTIEDSKTIGIINTEEILLGSLLFHIPNEGILKDTFDLTFYKRDYSNKSKIILVHYSDTEELNYMQNLTTQNNNISIDVFQDYFEINDISNNYQLVKHAFNLKPSEISWFESNSVILVKYTLLRLKEMLLVSGYKSGFLNVEFENFKGFIFNPGRSQENLFITGFSNSGEEYSIISQGFDFETMIELIKRIENGRNKK